MHPVSSGHANWTVANDTWSVSWAVTCANEATYGPQKNSKESGIETPLKGSQGLISRGHKIKP